ncbi:MAG: hypothetical protein K2X74_09965 [Acetobacteraceae bacterium]|nr:hypothetical protein [Acetobacteraceae bacterium]
MQGGLARRRGWGEALLTGYALLGTSGAGQGVVRLARGARAALLVLFGLMLVGVPVGRALLVAMGYAVLALAGASAPLVSGTATLIALGGLVCWSLGIDIGVLRSG